MHHLTFTQYDDILQLFFMVVHHLTFTQYDNILQLTPQTYKQAINSEADKHKDH